MINVMLGFCGKKIIFLDFIRVVKTRKFSLILDWFW
jgi:hypothetical protein